MKNKNIFLAVISFLIFSAFVNAQNPIEFELKSITGSSDFVLSEAKGKMVALHFLLKTECPYCMRHTHDYMSNASKLSDVLQVFVKPDTEMEIKEWASSLEDNASINYPIYRDPDAALAKAFNVPDGYYFHNQMVHYPALILLDINGKEVFRYIGKNNRDRFSFDDLVKKVEELNN